MNKRYPKLWHGLLFFVIVMVVMYVVAIPVQVYYGLTGVAITEVILLGMAVTAAAVSGKKFADVFPFTFVSPLRLLGCFLLYLCVFLAILPLTNILMHFFPQLGQTADGITDVATQYGSFWAVIIVAVMPALCEEAVFRGYILSSFKSMDGAGSAVWKLFAVIGVGLMFGVFHMSPERLLQTAILGGLFTYVAAETASMLPAILLHLVNNLISVASMLTLSKLEQSAAEELAAAAVLGTTEMIASCLVYFGISLLFGRFGWCLLKKRQLISAATAAAVVAAFLMIAAGTVMQMM